MTLKIAPVSSDPILEDLLAKGYSEPWQITAGLKFCRGLTPSGARSYTSQIIRGTAKPYVVERAKALIPFEQIPIAHRAAPKFGPSGLVKPGPKSRKEKISASRTVSPSTRNGAARRRPIPSSPSPSVLIELANGKFVTSEIFDSVGREVYNPEKPVVIQEERREPPKPAPAPVKLRNGIEERYFAMPLDDFPMLQDHPYFLPLARAAFMESVGDVIEAVVKSGMSVKGAITASLDVANGIFLRRHGEKTSRLESHVIRAIQKHPNAPSQSESHRPERRTYVTAGGRLET